MKILLVKRVCRWPSVESTNGRSKSTNEVEKSTSRQKKNLVTTLIWPIINQRTLMHATPISSIVECFDEICVFI